MNVIRRFGALTRNFRPSPTERRPGTLPVAFNGGIGGNRKSAYKAAVNVSASTAYAASTPCQPMMTPPSNGPSVKPRLNDAIVRAFVAGNSSRDTMRGRIA